MRKVIILTIVFTSFILGCENSDKAVNTAKTLDGLSLFGFTDGRTLVYLQTDTTIAPDTYEISITNSTLSILITGSGDDWIIHKDSTKLINLKVGSSSIIQNGYWKNINGQDSLLYFAAPPLLMERTLSNEISWGYFTPFFEQGTTPIYLPFYYANFGYQVIKEYKGIETIITPAGEFDTHRFDLHLFTSAFGNEPIAEISEYYVQDIGLVKKHINIGALRSSIILANYSN